MLASCEGLGISSYGEDLVFGFNVVNILVSLVLSYTSFPYAHLGVCMCVSVWCEYFGVLVSESVSAGLRMRGSVRDPVAQVISKLKIC